MTVTDDEGHEAEFTSAPTSAVEAGPRPSVTVASDGDVTEGSPAVFTLTRTRNTAGTLDVDYEVTATGDFGVAAASATATFLANESTVRVSVATTDDEVHEAHGSVTVTLTADGGRQPRISARRYDDGDGGGSGRRRLAGDRGGDGHGHGDGRRDADGGSDGHRRRGRSGQRGLRLAVGADAVRRR